MKLVELIRMWQNRCDHHYAGICEYFDNCSMCQAYFERIEKALRNMNEDKKSR